MFCSSSVYYVGTGGGPGAPAGPGRPAAGGGVAGRLSPERSTAPGREKGCRLMAPILSDRVKPGERGPDRCVP